MTDRKSSCGPVEIVSSFLYENKVVLTFGCRGYLETLSSAFVTFTGMMSFFNKALYLGADGSMIFLLKAQILSHPITTFAFEAP